MKKAKIMLTAITVLAIVGGALAFKAKTLSQGWYQVTCSSNDICVTTEEVKYTVAAGQPQELIGTTDQSAINQPCDLFPDCRSQTKFTLNIEN
jgi:hypothetical protein